MRVFSCGNGLPSMVSFFSVQRGFSVTDFGPRDNTQDMIAMVPGAQCNPMMVVRLPAKSPQGDPMKPQNRNGRRKYGALRGTVPLQAEGVPAAARTGGIMM
jgi:hypothetical protein